MGFGGSYQGPSESELAARRQEERAYNEAQRQRMRQEALDDEARRKAEEEKERVKRAEWAAKQEQDRLKKEAAALEGAAAMESAGKQSTVITQGGGAFENLANPGSMRPQ